MEKQKEKLHKKLQKYKKKQIIIIAILLICFLSIGIIFGRYITESMSNYFVRSEEFYFNSDKLAENRADYQIENWSGVDDYVITINMNSNNNNLQSADYDIGYKIKYTCSSNAICQASKEEGVIRASTNSDYFNLTITPNTRLETGDKIVIDVEVESTAQYKKTLSGRFTLIVGKENITYTISDEPKQPYMELSITNTLSYYNVQEAFGDYNPGDRIDGDTYLTLTEEEKNKCYSAIVTIDFDPREILLDMTEEIFKRATNIQYETIDGTRYIRSFEIKIDAISSENLRFYKVDPSQDYTYPNNFNTSIVEITSI